MCGWGNQRIFSMLICPRWYFVKRAKCIQVTFSMSLKLSTKRKWSEVRLFKDQGLSANPQIRSKRDRVDKYCRRSMGSGAMITRNSWCHNGYWKTSHFHHWAKWSMGFCENFNRAIPLSHDLTNLTNFHFLIWNQDLKSLRETFSKRGRISSEGYKGWISTLL